MWARHSAERPRTAQVSSQWREADALDPRPLEIARAGPGGIPAGTARGDVMFISREYGHLVTAYGTARGKRRASFFRCRHPSGLGRRRRRREPHIASTREPYEHLLAVARDAAGSPREGAQGAMALPIAAAPPAHGVSAGSCGTCTTWRSIGGELHAEREVGARTPSWRCHPKGSTAGPVAAQHRRRRPRRPLRSQRHLPAQSQLRLDRPWQQSFFSASSAAPGRRRPGHLDYPVDKRGVIFSGTHARAIRARLNPAPLWPRPAPGPGRG